MSNQWTQRNLWIPLVHFLLVCVHITFCRQTRKWPRVAYDPVHSSKGIVTSTGVVPVQLSMHTAVLQASAHSSFGNPLAWSKERVLSTIVQFSCTAAPFCSEVYDMASRCVIPCSSSSFCTASQLNSLPPSESRTFVTCPAFFTSFRNFRRQSTTSLFVVMKNTWRYFLSSSLNRSLCHGTMHICVNVFFIYAQSNCPSSEDLPMCISQSTAATKFFVCLHINTMLLEHFHNMALILMTKTLMPYLQCFHLHCQLDLRSVLWNTHLNRQYIKVINKLTRCCNSSITSANNSFLFIQGCAVAVWGSCLDGE